MTKRILCLCTALMLLCLSVCPALARAIYPEQRGAVNDDAAVLSSQTAEDILEYNARLEDVQFTVVTRHFLGGADAQEYCDGLFEAWNLDEDDALLLMVIGEERYAVHLGEKVKAGISSEQVNSLLSSQFRSAFINDRDYDGAVGAFLTAAGEQIARVFDLSFTAAGLFGTEAVLEENAIFDNWSGAWWEGFFGDSGSGYEPLYDDDFDALVNYSGDTYYYEENEDDSGFSFGKLVFIAIALYYIVKNRRRKGKSGLGLFGWLLAGAGAKEIGKAFRGYPGPRRRR